MGGTLVGIYSSSYTHGRHHGGYIPHLPPMGGTLVGILPFIHPWEAPCWVYSLFLHPWEAPWWVLVSSYTLGGTLVGISLLLPLGGTQVGIILPFTPWEAPWWV